jgi:hypothetical protein
MGISNKDLLKLLTETETATISLRSHLWSLEDIYFEFAEDYLEENGIKFDFPSEYFNLFNNTEKIGDSLMWFSPKTFNNYFDLLEQISKEIREIILEHPNIEGLKFILKDFAKNLIYWNQESHPCMRCYSFKYLINLIEDFVGEPIIRPSDFNSLKPHVKLKWTGKPAQLGYIMNELAEKGFIEIPKTRGDISYSRFAKVLLELFEIETTKANLENEVNPDKNSLGNLNRKKLSIPNLNDL